MPAELFLQPRVEPELAFVLGAGLRGPGVTVAQAARAVDAVLPALEIVDSRIRDWRITLFDTVADNASSGGVVLGDRAVRPAAVDLGRAHCTLFLGDTPVESGNSGAVLGHPLRALTWLANTLGTHGVELEAGHIVLSGAITATVALTPGDRVTAEIAGVGRVITELLPPSR